MPSSSPSQFLNTHCGCAASDAPESADAKDDWHEQRRRWRPRCLVKPNPTPNPNPNRWRPRCLVKLISNPILTLTLTLTLTLILT